MIDHAIYIANNDYYGYSWADRWDHDRDCSSLMYDSADAGGYPVGRGPDKTRYTGTMIDDFEAAGFTCNRPWEVSLYPGCILLRDPWGSSGHTEMYIGDGQTVGAHIAETGGVYGEPGDQTGYEISVTDDPGGWDYVLVPPEEEPAPFIVRGPNLMTAHPVEATITHQEIAHCLDKSIAKIETSILHVLENTPPELYADIVENGIYLSGGGALLRGLAKRFQDKVNIQFHVSEDPLHAVARGTCDALKHTDRYTFLMR